MRDSPPSYQDFFKNAVANPSIAPYDWQERLAKIGPCQSLLVDIPTGLGLIAKANKQKVPKVIRDQGHLKFILMDEFFERIMNKLELILLQWSRSKTFTQYVVDLNNVHTKIELILNLLFSPSDYIPKSDEVTWKEKLKKSENPYAYHFYCPTDEELTDPFSKLSEENDIPTSI